MLLNKTPDVVDEAMTNEGGYTNGNLVTWNKLPSIFPQIKSATRYQSYNNDVVLKAIEKNGGCLVEVDGKRIGASRHWVLYIGNGQMIDPWFGTTKSTNYYPATGCAVIELQSNPEPMPEKTYTEEDMKKERDRADKHWVLYQEEIKKVEKISNDLEFVKTELENQKTETQKQKDEVSAWKKQYNEFIDSICQIITLPKDSPVPTIIAKLKELVSFENKAIEYADLYEREVQARKADALKHQEQLQAFSLRIDKMEENHTQEVNDLQERHQQEIERLRSDLEKALKEAEVANEALITVTRFSSFWKGITRIIKG